MGERTNYTPGAFSWTDLTTADQEGAKSFYDELFAWEGIDSPVGDGVVYTMEMLDGKPVAAIAPQPRQQGEMGIPPAWNSYVTVDSADETLGRARDLVIKNTDGRSNGGIRPMMPEEPPYWLVYFGSDDVDATADKVKQLGGGALAEPMDIGVGKLSIVRDPQGAVFALYGGQFED